MFEQGSLERHNIRITDAYAALFAEIADEIAAMIERENNKVAV